jgi:hypothetical protein
VNTFAMNNARYGKLTARLIAGWFAFAVAASALQLFKTFPTLPPIAIADRGGSLVPEIANLASGAGVELCDVHILEPSLENLFLHHTGRSLRD